MSIQVTKEVNFAAAHMLAGHEGLCKNLHGHNYKVEVTVSRENDTELISEGSSNGMVVDFKALKQALNEVIVEPWDHAYIIDTTLAAQNSEENRAALVLGDTVRKLGLKHVDFCGRPTAEHMAEDFFHKLEVRLQEQNLKVVEVKVWETPTSFATARRDK